MNDSANHGLDAVQELPLAGLGAAARRLLEIVLTADPPARVPYSEADEKALRRFQRKEHRP